VTGIEKYIGAGLIKGIRPVMAKRIVQEFEKETLYRRHLKIFLPTSARLIYAYQIDN
jgi:hypothetical protein